MDETTTGIGKRAALYIRVSTHEQKALGFGLEAQEKNLRDYLAANTTLGLQGSEIAIYSDVHTGSEMTRPQLQRLIKDVKSKKVDVVVVWKIDRLSRSLKHLIKIVEVFEKHQVSFVSVQENVDFRGPIGKLVFNMFASIAEFERELIRGRTHMGKIASAQAGNYLGAWAPYGYQKVKNASGKGSRLQINPNQAKWVRKMFHWYVYDNLSPPKIAIKLNEIGVPFDAESRSHKTAPRKWSGDILDRLLSNPVYRGVYVACNTDEYGHELPEQDWILVETPRIVRPVLWFEAQECRKDRRLFHGRVRYLLSGRIIDGSASGCRTFSGVARTKGGHSYRRNRFVDRDGNCHPTFEVPAAQIDEYVWALVTQAIGDPERFIRSYKDRQATTSKEKKYCVEQIGTLQKRVAEIEELEIPRIQSAFEKGIYSEETTTNRLMGKELELKTLRTKIEENEQRLAVGNNLECASNYLNRLSRELRDRIHHMTIGERQAVCAMLVERVTLWRELTPAGKRITGSVTMRLREATNPNSRNSVRTLKPSVDRKIQRKTSENLLVGQLADQSYKKLPEISFDGRCFHSNFEIVKLPKIVGCVVRSTD